MEVRNSGHGQAAPAEQGAPSCPRNKLPTAHLAGEQMAELSCIVIGEFVQGVDWCSTANGVSSRMSKCTALVPSLNPALVRFGTFNPERTDVNIGVSVAVVLCFIHPALVPMSFWITLPGVR
ncbi:unnamed protein product [Schistocephalus solidus]|uniref:Uncharacterized protein n=1 Tax=Schistocephalus solidus TaxID=70667 RepID=A0A183TPP3_SCHSO|nr:unnamed protein product [Schistocephalus solidus]